MKQIQRMLDVGFNKFPAVEGLIFHSDYTEENTMPKFLISA